MGDLAGDLISQDLGGADASVGEEVLLVRGMSSELLRRGEEYRQGE